MPQLHHFLDRMPQLKDLAATGDFATKSTHGCLDVMARPSVTALTLDSLYFLRDITRLSACTMLTDSAYGIVAASQILHPWAFV